MPQSILLRVIGGSSDQNIRFDELRNLLLRLHFAERIRGSHHIFTREGVAEIVNLQPKGSRRKHIRSNKYVKFWFNINWQKGLNDEVRDHSLLERRCEAFIAEVPELAGCAADGPTRQEALANVEVVIAEWLETARELGRPIPEPKGRLLFA